MWCGFVHSQWCRTVLSSLRGVFLSLYILTLSVSVAAFARFLSCLCLIAVGIIHFLITICGGFVCAFAVYVVGNVYLEKFFVQIICECGLKCGSRDEATAESPADSLAVKFHSSVAILPVSLFLL